MSPTDTLKLHKRAIIRRYANPNNLTAMMEPMIMVVLGVVLGGLVVAMYLPIFQMGSLVGG